MRWNASNLYRTKSRQVLALSRRGKANKVRFGAG